MLQINELPRALVLLWSAHVSSTYMSPDIKTEHIWLCVHRQWYIVDRGIQRQDFLAQIRQMRLLNLPCWLSGCWTYWSQSQATIFKLFSMIMKHKSSFSLLKAYSHKNPSESRIQSFRTNTHSCKHHNKIMWASNTQNNTQFIFLFPLYDYVFHFSGVESLGNKWVSLIFVSRRSSFPGSIARSQHFPKNLHVFWKTERLLNLWTLWVGRASSQHPPATLQFHSGIMVPGHNHRVLFTPSKWRRTDPFTPSWGITLHPWRQAPRHAFQCDSTSSPEVAEYFPSPDFWVFLSIPQVCPADRRPFTIARRLIVSQKASPKLLLSITLHICGSSPASLQPRRHLKISVSPPASPKPSALHLTHAAATTLPHRLLQSCEEIWPI